MKPWVQGVLLALGAVQLLVLVAIGALVERLARSDQGAHARQKDVRYSPLEVVKCHEGCTANGNAEACHRACAAIDEMKCWEACVYVGNEAGVCRQACAPGAPR